MSEYQNYLIIESDSIGELCAKVDEYLEVGYIPLGGISVTLDSHHVMAGLKYHQALARKKEH